MTVRYSSTDKLELVLASYRHPNVRAFCRLHNLDPTTLYGWRRELADAALAAWRSRRPGRPSSRSRETAEALRCELDDLRQRHQDLEHRAERWRLWAALAQSVLERHGPRAGLAQLLGAKS